MKMTISNGFDSLNRKIWKFYLKKYKNSLKNWDSSSKNCQKLRFLPQIGEFFFLKSNIKSKNLSQIKQFMYLLKFWL